MLIVGLTGGIASGKSTVSRRIREQHGIPVVDADVIAREVVEPGQSAYSAIVAFFGPKVPDLLLDDGHLDRAALGRAIFGNEDYRKRLNAIVHPAVRRAMAWQIGRAWIAGHSVVVADVPLLFEARLDKFCGATLVVLCSPEKQYDRLRIRDPHLSELEAKQRIAAQMPLDEKRKLGQARGIVIDNDGSVEELNAKVDDALARLSPSPLRTYLEWLPPVGLAAAFWSWWSAPV